MTQHSKRRLAMTAIAAVLAFPATPLLAQAAAPTDAPAPVSVSPPAAVATPAPTPDALAPTAPTPVTTSADVPPSPVATAPVAKVQPVRTSATRTTARTVSHSAAPARAVHSSTIATASKVAAPTPLAVPPTVALAPVAPVEAIPPLQPVAAAPVPTVTTQSADETLPIAGAAGLGILALAGVGLAMRRRRRIADEMLLDEQPTYVDELTDGPVVASQPALVTESAVAMPVIAAPMAAVNEAHTATEDTEFDTSGFSPRVQAAYAGPTEDNPSLAVKKRVKRAHAIDQMEANGAEVASVAPAAAPARSAPQDAGFMIRRASQPMRPAYQK